MARIETLVVMMALSASACSKEPSRWAAAEQTAEQKAKPGEDAPEKTAGSALNAYFPTRGPNGAARVFTAEKPGYAEAKLTGSDGAEVALLSIAEAAPDAVGKFAGASEQVAGHPLVTVGKNQSSVLVNERFQVKVSSKTLGPPDRKTILASFDLAGLAKR